MKERTPKPSQFHTETVPNAATQICGQSPDRRALLFSVTTADVFISPDPAIVAGQGIRVVNGQAPVEICACHQGSFVTLPLFAITTAGTATLYVVEGFEPLLGN